MASDLMTAKRRAAGRATVDDVAAASRSPRFRSAMMFPGAAALVVLMALMPGCDGSGGAVVVVPSGTSSDLAEAREVIDAGGVPNPSAVQVKTFMADHEIPIDEPADAGELFLTASAGLNQDFDEFSPLVSVLVGFGSGSNPSVFNRDPLNLALVIDTTSSMDNVLDSRTSTTRLEAVRIAVDGLLAHLEPEDKVSIITFSSLALTRVEAAAGDDVVAIKSALEDVGTGGQADLARALRSAFGVLERNAEDGLTNRLILFTDEVLEGREQRTDEMIGVLEDNADAGYGATVLSIVNDIGDDAASNITQVSGGNYRLLKTFREVVDVFDDAFDLLVSPLASEIRLRVTIPFTLDAEGVYGVEPPSRLSHAITLNLPASFLATQSRTDFLMIRLRPGSLVDFAEDTVVAELELSYTDRQGESVVLPVVEVTLPEGLAIDDIYFVDTAVHRAVVLLNTVLVLRESLEDAYPVLGIFADLDDQQRAIDRITAFLPYFDQLAAGLRDTAADGARRLSDERELLERLLFNVYGE